MSANDLSRGISHRLRWAIREAVVITGILVFWLAVGLVLAFVIRIVAFGLYSSGIDILVRGVRHPVRTIWAVVLPMASATTGLYILARVGTILIDRYQSGPAT